ncbi:hypothetical protein LTR91_001796 [Friedmanniomyces endolithicus]|uniref:DUF7053 domain-containing protein n=1 Tax=Friedmanniomyces endolithicus TaxID=329885 RepID=A0AAN6FUY0_9PEZI|nr:hypothetical protein LTR35_003971 [Friedmanniomyces endolithicus]KAK0300211.1 hypothetical protein LTS00_001283 [Friedmanniomyces endolithicus]KAK0324987.1 hypothetical protein LTR82_003973 [Friedmanniomyces endolithicus]KAK0999983.1 hypothetical protein LTR54_008906 [Friedmanniomyces endolithicus]KAK1004671.1 hypothetical protein LTS01_003681 [Friedmanniomyces endolithicus]
MSRRSFITNITPLPPTITRETALALLHDHDAMIELNPLVVRHAPTTAPPNATVEEQLKCKWILITDTINYLPGGAAKSEMSYKAGFYDLPYGIQTHCFAPGGVDLKAIWRVGGNMYGEPPEAPELGIAKPSSGLYLREDVEVKCNMFLSGFVKKNLKKSHATLVKDLLNKHSEPVSTMPAPLLVPSSPVDSIGSIPSFRPMTPESIHDDTTPTVSSLELSRQLTNTAHWSQCTREEPCSCGLGGHEVMCPNYRYGAPPPRKASPAPQVNLQMSSQPFMDMRWPPQADRSPVALSDAYSPVGVHPESKCKCRDGDHIRTCQYYEMPHARKAAARLPTQQAKGNSHGRLVWKLPPGSSPSVAFRSPQLFGEQAELPGDTVYSERDEDWADDETLISELDNTEMAYWRTEDMKQAPGDAGWI